MNMSQAVQLFKGLEKQYRAVLAMGEVMEEIVNLEDMLDEAEGLTETSRLACQVIANKDMVVRIPEIESEWDNDTF